jgi:hypothetical protein
MMGIIDLFAERKNLNIKYRNVKINNPKYAESASTIGYSRDGSIVKVDVINYF